MDQEHMNAADAGQERKPRTGRRQPKKITAQRLERVALAYLEKYAAPAAGVRRVLQRRVAKAARVHDTDIEAAHEWIEDVIARLIRSGLVDDTAYAEMRAGSLHRQGASARMTRAKLAAKGVGAEDIDAALDTLAETVAAPDLAAACNWARRRRLGRWRRRDREDHRDRDLASLGRQGFGYELARKVVDAEDREELEREALSEDSA